MSDRIYSSVKKPGSPKKKKPEVDDADEKVF